MAAKPEQTPSVLTTLQSEVSSEASPMLQFLVRHAVTIVIIFLLFIAAIAGYWIYSWQSGKQSASDARALGAVLVISHPAQRLGKLEEYLASAPESMKGAAWFAAMESARQLNDYPKLYEAWQAISALDPSLKVTAGLGMASALSGQGKAKEALALLDGLSANLSQADSMLVNSQIVSLAEALGDYTRALAACDALTKLPDTIADVNFWTQKKAELELKTARTDKP